MAYIRTAVGAQGFIRVDGYVQNNLYHVFIGKMHFAEKTIADLVDKIHQQLHVDFLEYNVKDCCLVDVRSNVDKCSKL